MSFFHYILVFLITIFAGFYGSIFGGGSFVIFPVLFLFGVDPKIAVATNAAAATGNLISSSIVFYKRGGFNSTAVKQLTPFLFLGGLIGIFLLIKINTDLILILVTASIILFALFGLFKNKKTEKEVLPSRQKNYVGAFLSVPLGIYNVTISAGTATLLTYILIHFQGLTVKQAIMTRPFISIPVLFTAAFIFSLNGLIDWRLLIPLFLGWMFGAFFGAHTVVRMKSDILGVVFNVLVIFLAIYGVFHYLG